MLPYILCLHHMSLQRRCMDHIYHGDSVVAVSLEIGLQGQGQDVLSQILAPFFILGLCKSSFFILNYRDLISIYTFHCFHTPARH